MPVPARLSEVVVKASRVAYLHGFASSARSTKAAWFAERLQGHDVTFDCPDFNEPEFATLTLTRMIDQLGTHLAHIEERVTLMGSSLGGTLAILAAGSFKEKVDRIVLLAPAVMFA